MSKRAEAICIVQRGCGACHEFVPRLRAALRGTGIKLTVHDMARSREAYKLGEHYRVRATPTTLVQTPRGTLLRRVGNIGDAELARFIRSAAGGA